MMVIVLARNWWALALRGLFAVLLGIMAFAWPGITLGALVLLYGAFVLADGIFAIVAALVGRTQSMPWWALLLEGVTGIAVGLLTFFWPGITALVLLYLIASWALVTGAFEIAAAIRLRKEVHGEWLLALSGVLSILFGLALVVNPGAGALAVIWLIGAYAIASGVLLIVLGFKLRSWLRSMSSISSSPSADAVHGHTSAVDGRFEIGASEIDGKRWLRTGRGRRVYPGHSSPGMDKSTSIKSVPVSWVSIGASKGGSPWRKARRSLASTWGRPTASSRSWKAARRRSSPTRRAAG